MKREKYLSWESYFMSVAVLSSFRSKDPKVQNGAVIVDSTNKVVGIGYNGLSIGLDDSDKKFWGGEDDDSLSVNPRHAFCVHAERNAVLNSNLRDLKGTTMYCTQYPCHVCAQELVQVGVSKIVYINKKPHHKQVNDIVKEIFKGGKLREFDFRKLKNKDKDFVLNMFEKRF
jgi:dCMP deaminase